jgi:hypothetical protein
MCSSSSHAVCGECGNLVFMCEIGNPLNAVSRSMCANFPSTAPKYVLVVLRPLSYLARVLNSLSEQIEPELLRLFQSRKNSFRRIPSHRGP